MVGVQKTQHMQSGVFQLGRTLHGMLDELLASPARESGRIGQPGRGMHTVRKLPPVDKACATVTVSKPAPEKKSAMSKPAFDAVGELVARARRFAVEPWSSAKIKMIESEDLAQLAYSASSWLQREFVRESNFIAFWRRLRR